MGVQMGFETGDARFVPRGFCFTAPMLGDVFISPLPGRFARFFFAGFVKIYQLCHGLTVAQLPSGVYLKRMKILDYLKGHWQLAAILAVVFALWPFPVLLPLKILVVFLHEFSHAAAAWITGGAVEEISLNLQQGGHVISRGGSLFWIITAGYLGSLLLGSLLLALALQTRLDKAMVGGLGLVMVALALIYMRTPFAFLFCLGTGGAFGLVAWFLDHRINDLVLRVIGLTSMIYVPYDIFSDTILRSQLQSDARIMAENIGGPTLFWGVLWLIISLVWVGFVMRFALRTPSNISFQWRRSGQAPRG